MPVLKTEKPKRVKSHVRQHSDSFYRVVPGLYYGESPLKHDEFNEPDLRYKIVALLGEGCSSKVVEVEDKTTGKHYALKLFCRISYMVSIEKQELEMSVHRRIDDLARKGVSPSPATILPLGTLGYDGGYDAPNILYPVLGRSLSMVRPHKISPETSYAIIKSVAEGLRTLHRTGLVHADVKLSNIFLINPETTSINDGQFHPVSLGDFGNAGEPSNRTIQAFEYRCPESFAGNRCSYPADVWSLGVAVYLLFNDKPPFDINRNASRDLQLRKLWDASTKLIPNVPEPIVGLVREMLEFMPTKRATIEEILAHPCIAAAPTSELPRAPETCDYNRVSDANDELNASGKCLTLSDGQLVYKCDDGLEYRCVVDEIDLLALYQNLSKLTLVEKIAFHAMCRTLHVAARDSRRPCDIDYCYNLYTSLAKKLLTLVHEEHALTYIDGIARLFCYNRVRIPFEAIATTLNTPWSLPRNWYEKYL